MRFLAWALAGLLMSALSPAIAGETSPASWDHVASSISDLADASQESGFAPLSIGNDARSRRFEDLLDEAIDRLSDGDIKNAHQEMAEIDHERAGLEDELAAVKFDAAAPQTGLMSSLFSFAAGSPDERAAKIEAKIKDLDAKKAGARQRLVQSLKAAGINLSDDQLDGLFAMATSDRLLDMMSAFANLKVIDAELLQATEKSGESIGAARRYYGLHATLAEAAAWMQWRFLDEIDHRFLPELVRITDEAGRLRGEAQSLMTGEGPDQKILAANLAAQDLTIRTASLYRQELQKQKATVQASYERSSRQLSIAVNTWKTVKVSSDLVTMIRNGDGDFKQLMELSLPDLRPFEGAELKAEFAKITGRLSGAPAS